MTKYKDTPVNQAAVDALVAEQSGTLATLINEAMHLAQGNFSAVAKSKGFMRIAAQVSSAITPYTPCKNGCNHCCYMSVGVSEFEATEIAAYLDRQPATGGRDVAEYVMDPDIVDRYTGVACTLLGDNGVCTVYPVRPFACRTHHNLAATADNCRVTPDVPVEERANTPSINLTQLGNAFVEVAYEAGYAYADIREWFPKEAT